MSKLFKSGLLITGLSIAISGAQSAEITHSFNAGAGLGFGYSRFNFKVNEAAGVPSVLRKYDLAKNTPLGNLSLGYRLRWCNLMAGLEADYLFGDFKRSGDPNYLSNGATSRPSQASSNGAFGAALKVGYYLSPDVVGYVGAGIETRKFKFGYIIQGQPADSISSSYTQTAFAGRLGFDFALSRSVTLGAEYRKAFYNGQIKQNGTTTVKFKPETLDTVLLHVRFTFDLPKTWLAQR